MTRRENDDKDMNWDLYKLTEFSYSERYYHIISKSLSLNINLLFDLIN